MQLLEMLVCPTNRLPLVVDGQSALCPRCGVVYQETAGIWKPGPSSSSFCESSEVMEWFDKRAETTVDEEVQIRTPDKWDKRFFEKDVTEIQKLLDLKHTDILLDVGCGNGPFLERYASMVREAVGIDISFEMLKRARKHLEGENVMLMQEDALHLPFGRDIFDAVLSIELIHYFRPAEILKFFLELKRVVKRGGRIFLGGVPVQRSLRTYEAKAVHLLVKSLRMKAQGRYLSPVETTKFTPEQIESLAEKAGLKVMLGGTMRHVLPSIHVPYVGQFFLKKMEYLFESFDYRKSMPLISYRYFFVLETRQH